MHREFCRVSTCTTSSRPKHKKGGIYVIYNVYLFADNSIEQVKETRDLWVKDMYKERKKKIKLNENRNSKNDMDVAEYTRLELIRNITLPAVVIH